MPAKARAALQGRFRLVEWYQKGLLLLSEWTANVGTRFARMATASTESRSRIGVGLYTIVDSARISGANHETVRRWLSEKEGIVPRYFPKEEKMLTFRELMEIHFIHMFRREGVSFQAIRRTAKVASERFDTPYPFTVKRFDTDGRTIFATMISEATDREVIEDLQRGQFVFQSIVRPFFRKLEYGTESEDVLRYWPRLKSGRVLIDPARKFGKPIDAKSGIPTSVIYEAVNAGGGQSPAIVARWLGIPIAAVKAAVAFELSPAD
jgi:uncharacterized protein (DUF433 family)